MRYTYPILLPIAFIVRTASADAQCVGQGIGFCQGVYLCFTPDGGSTTCGFELYDNACNKRESNGNIQDGTKIDSIELFTGNQHGPITIENVTPSSDKSVIGIRFEVNGEMFGNNGGKTLPFIGDCTDDAHGQCAFVRTGFECGLDASDAPPPFSTPKPRRSRRTEVTQASPSRRSSDPVCIGQGDGFCQGVYECWKDGSSSDCRFYIYDAECTEIGRSTITPVTKLKVDGDGIDDTVVLEEVNPGFTQGGISMSFSYQGESYGKNQDQEPFSGDCSDINSGQACAFMRAGFQCKAPSKKREPQPELEISERAADKFCVGQGSGFCQGVLACASDDDCAFYVYNSECKIENQTSKPLSGKTVSLSKNRKVELTSVTKSGSQDEVSVAFEYKGKSYGAGSSPFSGTQDGRKIRRPINRPIHRYPSIVIIHLSSLSTYRHYPPIVIIHLSSLSTYRHYPPIVIIHPSVLPILSSARRVDPSYPSYSINVAASSVYKSFPPPLRRRVAAVSPPCRRRTAAVPLPCRRRRVAVVSSPCRRRDAAVSPSCRRRVAVVLSLCCC
ncbi:hypothetical protein EJ04DRAFT_520026 [Polyplosphaeria fusca]|uniref:Uncharacterized protein n=1 Tax=Polyplosphaeria fusca TaxID=682080 RepID=A0A9P4R7U1_9PLEO|nr:hypothetical protein EJ04DRAFT_520026 [Polyplosphaeria fusca]